MEMGHRGASQGGFSACFAAIIQGQQEGGDAAALPAVAEHHQHPYLCCWSNLCLTPDAIGTGEQIMLATTL